jgi:hypothetical protein
VEYVCPVCKGEGITKANVQKKIYTVKCPECMGWRHLYKKLFTVKPIKVKELNIQVFSKTHWLAVYKLSGDKLLYKILYEEVKNNKRRFYTDNKYSVYPTMKDARSYANKENKKLEALEKKERDDDAKRDLEEHDVMYGKKQLNEVEVIA